MFVVRCVLARRDNSKVYTLAIAKLIVAMYVSHCTGYCRVNFEGASKLEINFSYFIDVI